MEWLAAVLCGVVGVTLVTGAIAKVGEREAFLRTLDRLPVTRDATEFFSRIVPLCEGVLGMALLFGRPIAGPALGAGLLLGTFLVASVALRGADCGCGPFVPKRMLPRTVGVAAAIGGLVWTATMQVLPPVNQRLLAAGVFLVVLIANRAWLEDIRTLRAIRFRARTLVNDE